MVKKIKYLKKKFLPHKSDKDFPKKFYIDRSDSKSNLKNFLKNNTPNSPIRMVNNGINRSVVVKLGILQKNAGVTAAPTATPNIVRIPSPKGLYTFNFKPKRAAIRQLVRGPNNHGKGEFIKRNKPAPIKAMK